jgi:hypothetical protein
MNDMYVGKSPLERGHDEPEEDPLVTENNRLTDRIAKLTAEVEELRYDLGVAKELIDDEKREVAKYKAPLEQFMAQWESDIQFYNGLDGNDLASWAELFRDALKDGCCDATRTPKEQKK